MVISIKKYLLIFFLHVFMIGSASVSNEPPPPPNPPTQRTPFPGLDIDFYIPFILLIAVLLAFYFIKNKKNALA
jgi:hypothetical protein